MAGKEKKRKKEKEKKMNIDNPIEHPLRGLLIIHCASFVMLLSLAMALPFTMFAMAVRS